MLLQIISAISSKQDSAETSVPTGVPSVQINSDEIFVANKGAGQTARWYGRAHGKTLSNGVQVCVYANAASHIDTIYSVLMIRFSNDNGTTWTDENTDLDGNPVSGFPMHPIGAGVGDANGAGEPYLFLCPNGDLVVSMWNVDYGSSNLGTYISRSTNGGKSWTTPTQVDFLGVSNDNAIFMTDDDKVVNGVIYTAARRHTTAPAETASESIFLKSEDNGATWQYISSFNNPVTNPNLEIGLTYIGNDSWVAHGRAVDATGIYSGYLYTSTNNGLTWTQSEPTVLDGMGRQRVYSRSYVKGKNNWYLDPVLISHGFQSTEAPSSRPRRLCIYVSKDFGSNWYAPLWLHEEANDGGYGYMFYDADNEEYVSIQYVGLTSYFDGELRIIRWNLIWS